MGNGPEKGGLNAEYAEYGETDLAKRGKGLLEGEPRGHPVFSLEN
jgi:hypothetical protein